MIDFRWSGNFTNLASLFLSLLFSISSISHASTSLRPILSLFSFTFFPLRYPCFEAPSVSCPVWSALPALIILLLSQCTRMLVFYYDSLLLVFFLTFFPLSPYFLFPDFRSVFPFLSICPPIGHSPPSGLPVTLQSTLINELISTS